MNKKKNKVAVMFGGVSPEHEVSVITGLQVVENIDRKVFTPYAILLNKQGIFEYYKGLKNRRGYVKIKPNAVNFGRDKKGSFFQTTGLLKEKIYIDAAYLAFHGGNGESGQLQGFLETLDIPYTSPNVESSVITMNKVITKQILSSNGISTVEGVSVRDEDIKKNVDEVIKNTKIKLPAIIKPAHLGSSIGINIAKTKVELKKYLLEASHIDPEILIEKLISNFEEYNISVRRIKGKIGASEVERPISKDQILSFTDKYQRGGKKSGGMASLSRELPAKIDKILEEKLKKLAVEVFRLIRAKGMIRIDFMVSADKIYVTEVNPIPGSMSYYLWEASGVSFREQITDLIDQAIADFSEKQSKRVDYRSDIVEKFITHNIDH
ncbi:MAG: D-alanine-D-alanine ligase [Candidatus Woesebacteria bacterium GW2011_GWB1_43_14]|uniref:D-alanine--D-alanine ligase n=1 Tax=Candidatus Woesebacteria bacterium GW2011_GWB1_43_14 TaxID=1618578 RepID=A0A0G1DHJ4_9BACT|nr:MAG: D-alanine-D-alanine ligase [Candidatus Woesebacteria bacterium GW2011_GWA1_39_11b]KKS78435.1 MAG: D-alanine-D-alanine ligase [Candidatus Woesebacteria bacterium GW2011_GWC1_42_9]KKS97149.1 MAG: D-alanine-D-alanine ligase [Candidatus Woesebacteria bacterium GW2011_GWB1_43_14]